MTRDAPGDIEFVGLQSIADYFGISLSQLKKKHLQDMRQQGAVWWRRRGRAHRMEYFAKEGNLRLYASLMAQNGKGF